MASTKEATKQKKEDLPCTIDPKLFEAWQKLKRQGDSVAIAERFNWSRPPIDNALNYGHVKQDEIVGQINTFFKERLAEEKKAGEELLALQDEAAEAKERVQATKKQSK